MSWFLLWLTASGAELVLDAKVPVHLAVDGTSQAELYEPGVLTIPTAPGDHVVVVTVGGVAHRYEASIRDDAPFVVLVGRTGISLGGLGEAPRDAASEPEPEPSGPVTVRLRSAGSIRLMVQIGRRRVLVPPGDGVTIEVEAGDHAVSVRSSDGTSVFARGTLTVTGGDDLVMQVTEGALPETAGKGLVFHPDRS